MTREQRDYTVLTCGDPSKITTQRRVTSRRFYLTIKTMTIISDATDFSMYNRLQVSNILDGTSDTAGSCRTSRSGVSLRIGGPGELV